MTSKTKFARYEVGSVSTGNRKTARKIAMDKFSKYRTPAVSLQKFIETTYAVI